MASSHAADVVFGYIRVSNLEGLKRFTPADFDLSQTSPRGHTVLVKALGASKTFKKRLKVIEWLLQSGADPQQRQPTHSVPLATMNQDNTGAHVIPAAGHSAISFAFELLKDLRKGGGLNTGLGESGFSKMPWHSWPVLGPERIQMFQCPRVSSICGRRCGT